MNAPAAHAQSCGGLNQKACPVFKAGPQCQKGLKKRKGFCVRAPAKKACGGFKQPVCPAIKRGPRCNPGLTPYKKYCFPCGSERQIACAATQPGPRCKRGLTVNKGYCQACGGNRQPACPVLKKGPRCKPGNTVHKGFCFTCGGANQMACAALQPGRRCNNGLMNDGGWCKPCGRDKQKACPALLPGPKCTPGTTAHKGYCYACGRENQLACAALQKGRRCHTGLMNDGGWCKPCGRNKQKACPALLPGPRCKPGTTAHKGYCYTCGGENQLACAALQKGPSCQKGLMKVGEWCKACGGNKQIACPAHWPGPRCKRGNGEHKGNCFACGGAGQVKCDKRQEAACRPGLNPDRGFCAACGGLNQATCTALRACEKGLQPYNGRCEKPLICGQPKLPACSNASGRAPCIDGFAPDPITKLCEVAIVSDVKRSAIETAKRCYEDFKPMIRPMVNYFVCQKGLGTFNALKKTIKAKKKSEAVDILKAAACVSELNALTSTMKARGFQSFSLGVSGNVNVGVVGGSGEYFVATDLEVKRPTLYASVGGSLLTPGAEASVNGVVTAFYGPVDQLSGGGKSFSVSAKAVGGAGAAVGLSGGDNPRCTSFSASAGAGVAANAGTMSATQTVKLVRIPGPDFSEGCKDVSIEAFNRTGGTIKIVDVDFYDFQQDLWRSKVTRNRDVASGQVWQWKTKLQKVGGDQTRLRIQYRKRKGNGWSGVFNHLTPEIRCRKGTRISTSIR